MKKTIYILFSISLIILTYVGCNPEDDLPPNPFDNINYGDTLTQDIVFNNEFTQLHKNIFVTRCANPGCHDGFFEPDFRTVQSSYSTLVYHPIIKNNADEDFVFRVVPFKPAASVLYERITNCCFVNTDDRMPQDNIGVPLDDADIQAIEVWINNGAKDMFGQDPEFPNTEPRILYYVAVDEVDNNIEYSSNRVDSVFYNPFLVPNNTNFWVVVLIEDDSTEIGQLSNNVLKISSDLNNFSGATSINAVFFNLGGFEFWYAVVSSGNFTPNTVNYMRYYTNDGDHVNNTEMPETNMLDLYKTYWSFVVEP